MSPPAPRPPPPPPAPPPCRRPRLRRCRRPPYHLHVHRCRPRTRCQGRRWSRWRRHAPGSHRRRLGHRCPPRLGRRCRRRSRPRRRWRHCRLTSPPMPAGPPLPPAPAEPPTPGNWPKLLETKPPSPPPPPPAPPNRRRRHRRHHPAPGATRTAAAATLASEAARAREEREVRTNLAELTGCCGTPCLAVAGVLRVVAIAARTANAARRGVVQKGNVVQGRRTGQDGEPATQTGTPAAAANAAGTALRDGVLDGQILERDVLDGEFRVDDEAADGRGGVQRVAGAINDQRFVIAVQLDLRDRGCVADVSGQCDRVCATAEGVGIGDLCIERCEIARGAAHQICLSQQNARRRGLGVSGPSPQHEFHIGADRLWR